MSLSSVRWVPGIALIARLELGEDEMKIVGYLADIFDLFHVGHLNMLGYARDRCDYLIVGVTTDESARQSRGIKPVIPFAERVEIMRSIRFVDRAVADNLECPHAILFRRTASCQRTIDRDRRDRSAVARVACIEIRSAGHNYDVRKVGEGSGL
nr:adenylyltransferase/cytidyltransferase family protein [Burkholderia sp. BCC1644]